MPTPKSGTYAVVLAASKIATVYIGKLGTLELQPGFYLYVGSALGPVCLMIVCIG